MVSKKLIASAMLATIVASAATASAPSAMPDQVTYTIELRGWVPVICRAQVSQTQSPSQKGVTALGQLNEFCNDPNGYQVWVDYGPQMASANVIVDGHSIPLSQSGSTLISSSSTAAIAQRDLGVELPADGINGSLSVRVVPL